MVATDCLLKREVSMREVLVAKNSSLPARSVAVFGQPSLLRQELTGIANALEDCPGGEDLNILTDSLNSMRLLKNMQWGNFPLSLRWHPARIGQLLVHVVHPSDLTNRSSETEHTTSFIKFVLTEESYSMKWQTRWHQ